MKFHREITTPHLPLSTKWITCLHLSPMPNVLLRKRQQFQMEAKTEIIWVIFLSNMRIFSDSPNNLSRDQWRKSQGLLKWEKSAYLICCNQDWIVWNSSLNRKWSSYSNALCMLWHFWRRRILDIMISILPIFSSSTAYSSLATRNSLSPPMIWRSKVISNNQIRTFNIMQ